MNDGLNPPVVSGVSSPVLNGVSPAVIGNVVTSAGDTVNGARISIGIFDGNINVAGLPAVNIGPADGNPGIIFFDTYDKFSSSSLPTALDYFASNTNSFTPVLYTDNNGNFEIQMIGWAIKPSQAGVNFSSINWVQGTAQPNTTYYLGLAQTNANGNLTTGTISENWGSGHWAATPMLGSLSLDTGYQFDPNQGTLALALSVVTGGNLVAVGSATSFGDGKYNWNRPEGLMAKPYCVLTTITPPVGFQAASQQMQTAFWNGLPGSSVALDFTITPSSGVSGTLNYSISEPIKRALSGSSVVNLPLSKVRVFDDVNRNGKYDSGEPYVLTDSKGYYSLRLTPGYHVVTVDLPDGYKPGTDFERARPVTLANSTDVKHIPWNAWKPMPQNLPVSQILSPTRAVVYATPHFNKDSDGNLTQGYSIWLGQITGKATDQDGKADLKSVIVSIYDETARKYYYDASDAVDTKHRWTSGTWVTSRSPVYMTANGTANWQFQMPVMSLVNGHKFTIQSLALDKEMHVQAAASTRTFTFDTPYRKPKLELLSVSGNTIQSGVVNLKAFMVKQFAGQVPPSGSLVVNIDGHVRHVNFYNTAAMKFMLKPGLHRVSIHLPGSNYYPTLTSNTIKINILPKCCIHSRKSR